MSYEILDQLDEDQLHAQRLLNVEEKLFKRLSKRLLSPDSLLTLSTPRGAPPTPPPESNATEEAEASNAEEPSEKFKRWKEEASLDWAAFQSNIIRGQLLLNSNERERQRYSDEKLKILETAQAVKEQNGVLTEQLKEAQRKLEVRKGYDRLAERITNNKALKPCEEQHSNIEKLQREIAELQEETAEYKKTWAERREQFGKIVEEGRQLLRLIRDEKEEAERKEGMEEVHTVEEREQTPSRGEVSRLGTPNPAATPSGGATPAHVPMAADQSNVSQASKLREHEMAVDPVESQEELIPKSAPTEPSSQDGRAEQTSDAEQDVGNSGQIPKVEVNDIDMEVEVNERENDDDSPVVPDKDERLEEEPEDSNMEET